MQMSATYTKNPPTVFLTGWTIPHFLTTSSSSLSWLLCSTNCCCSCESYTGGCVFILYFCITFWEVLANSLLFYVANHFSEVTLKGWDDFITFFCLQIVIQSPNSKLKLQTSFYYTNRFFCLQNISYSVLLYAYFLLF